MRSPVLIILQAQWRIMTSFRMGGAAPARMLAIAVTALWYALWAGFGVLAGAAARGAPRGVLDTVLPWILLGVCGYWQVVPVASASAGAMLDLRKLLAWPIPERSLFTIECLLRLAATAEIALFLTAAAAGLAGNPAASAWGTAVALALLAGFNIFLAAGMRSLLERIFARRWLREAAIFLFVLAMALPQLFLYTGAGAAGPSLGRPWLVWPWTAAARFVLGQSLGLAGPVLLAWTAAAYLFGRWQFRRGLSFDLAAVAAAGRRRTGPGRLESVYRLPALLFRDPLAALLEKELRTYARAPRVRLVFLMGFSFGFIIWLPVLYGRGAAGTLSENYPVYVSLYALLLLAEVMIWNVFGFDRSAAQLYFAAPVPLSTVLVAKNLAALAVVVLEVACIGVVCAIVPLHIPAVRVLDAFLVATVTTVYLAASGDLSSVYYPKSVDPEHSWGHQASTRVHLYLLLLFPLLLIPVFLAYLARYAFHSDLAFYLMLAFDAAAGAAYYRVALDSAARAALRRREALLGRLSESSGPLATE